MTCSLTWVIGWPMAALLLMGKPHGVLPVLANAACWNSGVALQGTSGCSKGTRLLSIKGCFEIYKNDEKILIMMDYTHILNYEPA